jgi:Ribonuclease G/E
MRKEVLNNECDRTCSHGLDKGNAEVFIAHCVKEHDLHIELNWTGQWGAKYTRKRIRGCKYVGAGRNNYSALLHVNQLLERHVVEENQRGRWAVRLRKT